MSQDEKKRRKQLVRAVRDEERRKLRDSLPVPVAVIKGLLNYVDSQLQITECDDTLQHVRDFTRTHKLPEHAVITGFEGHGGYCDCEALANGEQVLEDAVPGYDKIIAE